MILKSILIWLSILPLAILNGALRQFVLNSWLGESIAQPVSGLLLSLIIFFMAFLLIPKLKVTGKKGYVRIGLLWVCLTLIFEFAMGFSTGSSLVEMLRAYNPLTGNLWILVVIVIGISPWLTAEIKRPDKTNE